MFTSETTYFEKWVRSEKRPIGSFTREQAERRHQSGLHYIAGVDRRGQRVLMDFAGKWVSVDFLDERSRVYETYDFKNILDGNALLTKVQYIWYVGDSDDIQRSVSHSFKENGAVFSTRAVAIGDRIEEKTESRIDVSQHRAKFPGFDDYTELLEKIDTLRPILMEY